MYSHCDRDTINVYPSSSFSLLILIFLIIKIQEDIASNIFVQHALFMMNLFCIQNWMQTS